MEKEKEKDKDKFIFKEKIKPVLYDEIISVKE
jgi:hypothetical protein